VEIITLLDNFHLLRLQFIFGYSRVFEGNGLVDPEFGQLQRRLRSLDLDVQLLRIVAQGDRILPEELGASAPASACLTAASALAISSGRKPPNFSQLALVVAIFV
jgi:hypothetical protein